MYVPYENWYCPACQEQMQANALKEMQFPTTTDLPSAECAAFGANSSNDSNGKIQHDSID